MDGSSFQNWALWVYNLKLPAVWGCLFPLTAVLHRLMHIAISLVSRRSSRDGIDDLVTSETPPPRRGIFCICRIGKQRIALIIGRLSIHHFRDMQACRLCQVIA